MSDLILTYELGTSGLPAVAEMPVRLYTTGSVHARVVACTGGEDNDVVGVAKASVATAGRAVPVAVNPGHRFQATVSTTVAAGAKLKINNRSNYVAAAAATTGIPSRYTARVLQARANTGLCWLEFAPREVV